jgi:N6-L-threonylcarbamoyladenine synthase
MKILAIDTSCDETAAAVTEGSKILSNIIWSQASAHAKFGGVVPSLAQRMHEERIDWVIEKALKYAKTKIDKVGAIAVTVGPGLSIALGVGINTAKEFAKKYNKKLIEVNHVEGHLLSPLAGTKVQKIDFPCLGLVLSGGNTIFVKVNEIGHYELLAQTTDDALGEALDKGARMLGFGYPGGAILEKFARDGKTDRYILPVPIAGQEKRRIFTYSGLKTAFSRLVESQKPLTREKTLNLAASYQATAFTHIIRVCSYTISHSKINYKNILVGGGVSANTELRKQIRKMCKEFGIKAIFPPNKKLTGDNAGMIGISAFLNPKYTTVAKIDRIPSLKIA